MVNYVEESFGNFQSLAQITKDSVGEIEILVTEMQELDRAMVNAAGHIQTVSQNTADVTQDVADSMQGQAAEVLGIYADPSLSGEPLSLLPDGIYVQFLSSPAELLVKIRVFTEPETLSLGAVTLLCRPSIIINYHSMGEAAYWDTKESRYTGINAEFSSYMLSLVPYKKWAAGLPPEAISTGYTAAIILSAPSLLRQEMWNARFDLRSIQKYGSSIPW